MPATQDKKGETKQKSLLSSGSAFLVRKKKKNSESTQLTSSYSFSKEGWGTNFLEIKELFLLPNPKLWAKDSSLGPKLLVVIQELILYDSMW